MVWRSWQYCKVCGLRECAWHLHEGTLQQPATLVLLREGVEGGPNACSVECRKSDLPRRWHSHEPRPGDHYPGSQRSHWQVNLTPGAARRGVRQIPAHQAQPHVNARSGFRSWVRINTGFARQEGAFGYVATEVTTEGAAEDQQALRRKRLAEGRDDSWPPLHSGNP